jgi:hypothetical protein
MGVFGRSSMFFLASSAARPSPARESYNMSIESQLGPRSDASPSMFNAERPFEALGYDKSGASAVAPFWEPSAF